MLTLTLLLTVAPQQTTCINGAWCQLPDPGGFCGAPIADSSGNDSQVADNFVPSQDGAVTSICWWGMWGDLDAGMADCGPAGGQAFLVRYHDNVPGAWEPGALRAGPMVVQPSEIDMGYDCTGKRVYQYSADHPPVPVVANEMVWVSIQSQGDDRCVFQWLSNDEGDHRYALRWRKTTWSVPRFPSATLNLSVCVDVPSHRLATNLGTRSCPPPIPNSRGVLGRLEASGSDSADANALLLIAKRLPYDRFGTFLASLQSGYTPGPGGSQGNLCLSSPFGIFRDLVAASDELQWVEKRIDLAGLPAPLPPVALAGQTWHFQFWYRDVNPTPTSNFTDLLSLALR